MMTLPPQVNTALDLLEQAGFEAFLVGGAVRDFVRGVPGTDWDITTNALPEQMKAVFSGYALIETGIRHGTVTVLIDRLPLEITTYRVDGSYSDHRHPDSVQFTSRLQDDLTRRDFTMNAMAYHPKKGITDPTGGRDDLNRRLIRCVGEPHRRFREDSLRILRALRFSSVLGMDIEPSTAAAIHSCASLLRGVAPERIQAELTKLLCGSHAERILLDFHDVLAVIMPDIIPMVGFCQHNPHHDRDVWSHTAAVVAAAPPTPHLRWAALLHDFGKPECFSLGGDNVGHFYGHAERSTEMAGRILSHLRFDNAGKERILRLIRYHDFPIPAEPKPVRHLLNKHGEEAARQLIELRKADTAGQSALCRDRLSQYDAVLAVIDEILSEQECFSLKDLAINGHDLLALELRGPQIGRILEKCLSAVMDEQIPNDREALLSFACSLQDAQQLHT